MHQRADVLIIGAGIAGITCALELLDGGQRVILIDRDQSHAIGGLAKWSFGGLFFVNSKVQRRSGIADSYERARTDWWSCAQFQKSETWGPRWAEQFLHLCTPHGYRWLCAKGIRFLPIVNWVERGMTKTHNSVPRFHIPWGTGKGLINTLINQLQNHPRRDAIEVLFQHRVTDLVFEQSRVTGVTGEREDNGHHFELRADQIVVATGGINGSLEKVRQHWHPDWEEPPKTILNGAHQFALGDLHTATQKVGGSVVHLNRQWNYAAGIRHYAPRKPEHGLSLVPGKSQLWLDFEGRRFGPPPLMSPYDTRYLVTQICAQPIKYSWMILNRKIALKEFAISGSEHNQAIRDQSLIKFLWQLLVSGNRQLVDLVVEKCEDVITADTLPQLVDRMNGLCGNNLVKLDYVQSAVEAFDAQLALGKSAEDEQVRRILEVRAYRGDKVRTARLQQILDPKAGPLMAIRCFVMSRKSLGGIETDLACRVLSKDSGDYLPGLYAIGEAAGFGGGNMHGHGSLEGTFLAGCIISGRVCAAGILGKSLD